MVARQATDEECASEGLLSLSELVHGLCIACVTLQLMFCLIKYRYPRTAISTGDERFSDRDARGPS